MVELHREPVGGHAGRLGVGLGARPLEEGDRVLGPDLEEVVAEGAGRQSGHQPHAEDPVVEAHGLVHVGGDEGEVVHSSPAGWFARLHVRNRRPVSTASAVALTLTQNGPCYALWTHALWGRSVHRKQRGTVS